MVTEQILTNKKRLEIHAADVVSMSIFFVIPALIFGIPGLSGHPVLTGDNLLQNYPLRVLVGRSLSSGHLPLWNPTIWSGTPLLAGFNAGALYPLSILFAVLNANVAWALGQIATYWLAATGIYVLCRHYRLRPLACFLAGISFAFAGAMVGQSEHIGLVEGTSMLPFGILAILKISKNMEHVWRPRTLFDREFLRTISIYQLGWIALLGLSIGFTLLSGEPRAVSNNTIVWVCVSIWTLVLRDKMGNKLSTKAWITVFLALGVTIGFCVGAAQLLPGLSFLHDSQRATPTLANFKSGSLPLPWTLLLVVPQLLGSSGSFGQPGFLGTYQPAEVTSYVGILPLVACVSLIYQVFSSHSRARRTVDRWLVWYFVGGLGMLLSLGGNTAIGRALWRVPLYGGQRLQSRNLMIVDLALTIILAFWLDDVLVDLKIPQVIIPEVDEELPEDERRQAIVARRQVVSRVRELDKLKAFIASPIQRLIATLVPIVGVVLVLVAMYWGGTFVSLFPDISRSVHLSRYRALIPTLSVQLGVILVGGFLAFNYRRIRSDIRRVVFCSFVIFDLLVFSATVGFDISPKAIGAAKDLVSQTLAEKSTISPGSPGGLGSTPSGGPQLGGPQNFTASSASLSRSAIYDPRFLNSYGLVQLGQPDTNIFKSWASIQGYSSIAPGSYADATGTHGQDTFSRSVLEPETASQLDLTSIYTLPNYLIRPVQTKSAPALLKASQVDLSELSGRNTRSEKKKRDRLATQSWSIGSGQIQGWSFGKVAGVTGMELTSSLIKSPTQQLISGVKVGLVSQAGQVYWPQSWTDSLPGIGFLSLGSPYQAVGIEIQNLSGTYPIKISNLVIFNNGPTSFQLAGPLAGYLQPAYWNLVGPAYGYQRFNFNGPELGAYLRESDQSSGQYRVVSGNLDGNVTIETRTAQPELFVRSIAYQTGWNATLTNLSTGGISHETITRYGLIQAVQVPAGQYRVTLTYGPGSVGIGIWLTCIGLVLAVGLLAIWILVTGRSQVFDPYRPQEASSDEVDF